MSYSTALLSSLKLDPKNPRFEESFPIGTDQITLLKELYKEEDVSLIIQDILHNDFDFVEPIIVTKDNDGKWVVLEGNRRTAAFMICSWKEYAEAVGLKMKSVMEPDTELQIFIYESRKAAQKYLHKRHVSKPHNWKPYAKNQFLYANYIDLEPKQFHRNSIEKLASDYQSSVSSIYAALVNYQVFHVIKQFEFFYLPVDTKKLDYSVFTTALGNPSIRSFLGLEKDLNKYHGIKFIDFKKSIKFEALKIFTTVVFDKRYGKNNSKAILDDSRKVTKLGEIFECENAVRELLNTKNIDQTYLNLDKLKSSSQLSLSSTESSSQLSLSSTESSSQLSLSSTESSSQLSLSSTESNSSDIIQPLKPFFSRHVSKKIRDLYIKFMESPTKKEASDNVIPLIDYLSKFKK